MRQTWDDDILRAANVLVRGALQLSRGERFVALGDDETQPILDALKTASHDLGVESVVLRLDQLLSYSTNHSGERPHKVLPETARRAMLGASASVFVASAPHAEASMRDQLLHLVSSRGVRHAHMPDATKTTLLVVPSDDSPAS